MDESSCNLPSFPDFNDSGLPHIRSLMQKMKERRIQGNLFSQRPNEESTEIDKLFKIEVKKKNAVALNKDNATKSPSLPKDQENTNCSPVRYGNRSRSAEHDTQSAKRKRTTTFIPHSADRRMSQLRRHLLENNFDIHRKSEINRTSNLTTVFQPENAQATSTPYLNQEVNQSPRLQQQNAKLVTPVTPTPNVQIPGVSININVNTPGKDVPSSSIASIAAVDRAVSDKVIQASHNVNRTPLRLIPHTPKSSTRNQRVQTNYNELNVRKRIDFHSPPPPPTPQRQSYAAHQLQIHEIMKNNGKNQPIQSSNSYMIEIPKTRLVEYYITEDEDSEEDNITEHHKSAKSNYQLNPIERDIQRIHPSVHIPNVAASINRQEANESSEMVEDHSPSISLSQYASIIKEKNQQQNEQHVPKKIIRRRQTNNPNAEEFFKVAEMVKNTVANKTKLSRRTLYFQPINSSPIINEKPLQSCATKRNEIFEHESENRLRQFTNGFQSIAATNNQQQNQIAHGTANEYNQSSQNDRMEIDEEYESSQDSIYPNSITRYNAEDMSITNIQSFDSMIITSSGTGELATSGTHHVDKGECIPSLTKKIVQSVDNDNVASSQEDLMCDKIVTQTISDQRNTEKVVSKTSILKNKNIIDKKLKNNIDGNNIGTENNGNKNRLNGNRNIIPKTVKTIVENSTANDRIRKSVLPDRANFTENVDNVNNEVPSKRIEKDGRQQKRIQRQCTIKVTKLKTIDALSEECDTVANNNNEKPTRAILTNGNKNRLNGNRNIVPKTVETIVENDNSNDRIRNSVSPNRANFIEDVDNVNNEIPSKQIEKDGRQKKRIQRQCTAKITKLNTIHALSEECDTALQCTRRVRLPPIQYWTVEKRPERPFEVHIIRNKLKYKKRLIEKTVKKNDRPNNENYQLINKQNGQIEIIYDKRSERKSGLIKFPPKTEKKKSKATCSMKIILLNGELQLKQSKKKKKELKISRPAFVEKGSVYKIVNNSESMANLRFTRE